MSFPLVASRAASRAADAAFPSSHASTAAPGSWDLLSSLIFSAAASEVSLILCSYPDLFLHLIVCAVWLYLPSERADRPGGAAAGPSDQGFFSGQYILLPASFVGIRAPV